MQSQPARRRRERQRSDARRAILDATEALLVEGGYEALSMRRLAERCGYSAPTIYHYFGDKPGLVFALLEERFRLLLTQLRRVRQVSDPVETMRRLGKAFLRFGLRYPTHYSLLMAEPRMTEEVPPSAEAAREILSRPLEELHAAGRLSMPDPETAAQALWATMHGLISLHTSRPDFDWSRNLTEQAIGMALRGIARPEAGAREEPEA